MTFIHFRFRGQMFQKNKLNNSGFGILEILVTVGILGVVMMGMISLGTVILNGQRQSNLVFQLETMRRTLTTLVNSPSSWNQIIAATSNHGIPTQPGMECLLPASTLPCTKNGQDLSASGVAIANQMISQILDGSGAVFYNPTQPTSGFTAQGTACNTFSPPPAVGNDACPIRYDITWSAICSTVSAPGTCISPQARIQITLVYNPGQAGSKTVLNPANYSATFIQGQIYCAAPADSTITWF